MLKDYQCVFQYATDFVTGDACVDAGHINVGVDMCLYDGLEFTFQKYDRCFITMCDTTCAIIRDNRQFSFVDSHAQNVVGFPYDVGASIVLYFGSLKDVCTHTSSVLL